MPQQYNPVPDYALTPITAITPGATMMWFGLPCPVEQVVAIDDDHTSLIVRYRGQIAGDTFENDQKIYVKRER